jgi:hypothetical protein
MKFVFDVDDNDHEKVFTKLFSMMSRSCCRSQKVFMKFVDVVEKVCRCCY